MADIRHLDIDATDNGIKTQSLVRNNETLTAGSANTNEYFGFYVNAQGGAWSYIPIDGKAAISFTPTANTIYPYHCSSITPHGSGTGHGNLGGHVYELIDPISEWTLTGTSTTTNDVLTVAIGDSADLDQDLSSVLPLIGASYNYSYTIGTFDSATKALITYGGVDIYDEAVVGTYTGTIVAISSVGLELDVDVVATADFTLSDISITRV